MHQQIAAPTLPSADDYEHAGRQLQHAHDAIERVGWQLRAYLGDELETNQPPRETSFADVGRLFSFVDEVASTSESLARVLAQLRERLVALNVERIGFEQDRALVR
jgi:hypothetical protein